MKEKKIPMRSCIVTREKLPKQQLIRIVRTPTNEIIIDESGRQNGRGAYLKKEKSTIEKAQKTNALSRHLEVPVPDIVFEELYALVEKEK